MNDTDVLGRIEHSALGPTTTPDDVIRVLDAAIEHGMRACVPPCYLDLASGYAPTVELSTVVGFPHGQHATATKVQEAREAWEDGADELDLVMNVGRLTAGEDRAVTDEIEEVVAAVTVPVKVIVETPLLSEAETRRAAECAVEADADFLKTATGFSEGGATVDDVALLAEYLPVKASGGIGSWERARAMFEAGAARIGASSGDVIAREYLDAPEAERTVDLPDEAAPATPAGEQSVASGPVDGGSTEGESDVDDESDVDGESGVDGESESEGGDAGDEWDWKDEIE